MYVIYVKLFVCYPEQVGEDMDTYMVFVIKVGEDMDTYVKPIQELGGETVYGPPNLTEAWQPCDAGHVMKTIKMIAKEKHETWIGRSLFGAKSSSTNEAHVHAEGYGCCDFAISPSLLLYT